MKKYLVTGGAGFIGSHIVKEIIRHDDTARVIVYDNFSSGSHLHLSEIIDNPALEIIEADLKDLTRLAKAMCSVDTVYHFASNPDISKAITQPDIDFWEGTFLTNNVLEAMRKNNIKNLLYASGSGIYGDAGFEELDEDYAFKLPISTYGASKLASEALICSYCYMFEINAAVFRFANVVGPNQTHGVGYDLVNKLRLNPKKLEILGDGRQSKSYIYVTDVISAMRLSERQGSSGFSYYNVATLDYITVKEIADIVVELMGLEGVTYSYTGNKRGWKGDVPILRFNSSKLRGLGWSTKYTSKEAIYKSIESLVIESKSK